MSFNKKGIFRGITKNLIMIFKTEADTAFEILQHFAKKSAKTMANNFCRKFSNIFYFGKNAEGVPAEH